VPNKDRDSTVNGGAGMSIDGGVPGGRDEESHVVPVTSVLQGRAAIPTLARVLISVVLVGVIAFVAGVQVSGRHSSDPVAAMASAAASPATAAGSPPTTAAVANALPDASDFALAFRPLPIIAGLGGGTTCVSGVTGDPGVTTAVSRRTLVRTWLTSCPVAPGRRAGFLDALMTALGRAIPSSVSSSTRGYKGMTLVYYLYTTGRFTGAVVLTARGVGGSLEITITLEDGPS